MFITSKGRPSMAIIVFLQDHQTKQQILISRFRILTAGILLRLLFPAFCLFKQFVLFFSMCHWPCSAQTLRQPAHIEIQTHIHLYTRLLSATAQSLDARPLCQNQTNSPPGHSSREYTASSSSCVLQNCITKSMHTSRANIQTYSYAQ